MRAAHLLSAAILLVACDREKEPAPAPAATWLAEPLAAVRTSTLAAGAANPVPEMRNPYADEPGAIAQGRQLFLSFNCAGCHGGAGGGGIGPPLADDQWIYGGSDANIYGHAALEGHNERFVVRTDRRTMPNMGDTVFVKPRQGRSHVFHATTGNRI